MVAIPKYRYSKQGIDPQQAKAEQEQKKQKQKQAELDNTFYAVALKRFNFKTEKGL